MGQRSIRRQSSKLIHEFVEMIPDTVSDGIIYVSIPYAIAVHKCCCGCGCEVVTPLSPSDWKLIFDGKTVSLDPSIGNWSFTCRSHYFVQRNYVRWVGSWSDEEIEAGRYHDRTAKEQYREQIADDTQVPTPDEVTCSTVRKTKHGFWQKISTWWSNQKRRP